MAVDYKKIGLVNTKDMFARAIKGGWAVPAFNFNNLEHLSRERSVREEASAGSERPIRQIRCSVIRSRRFISGITERCCSSMS